MDGGDAKTRAAVVLLFSAAKAKASPVFSAHVFHAKAVREGMNVVRPMVSRANVKRKKNAEERKFFALLFQGNAFCKKRRKEGFSPQRELRGSRVGWRFYAACQLRRHCPVLLLRHMPAFRLPSTPSLSPKQRGEREDESISYAARAARRQSAAKCVFVFVLFLFTLE